MRRNAAPDLGEEAMNIRKRFAASGIIVGALLVAPHVSAQAAFSQCDDNRVCGWGNNDFNWLIIERNSGLPLANHQGDANNELDSWANRSVTNARGYDGYNYQGECQTFWRGDSDNNVAPWHSDEVSSTSTSGGC